MKIIKAIETEKEFKIDYTDDEGELDCYRINVRFDFEDKIWKTHLSGEYDEEDLEVLKQITKELNKNYKKPVELSFEKDKKGEKE